MTKELNLENSIISIVKVRITAETTIKYLTMKPILSLF